MIQVQIDKLTSNLATLSSAIEDFRPYSQNFANKTADKLDGFNSDFIEKVKVVLSNMADTKAPDLLNEIDQFHQDGVNLVQTFKETDLDIAESEKLNK